MHTQFTLSPLAGKAPGWISPPGRTRPMINGTLADVHQVEAGG
jgi:hypothetical protein